MTDIDLDALVKRVDALEKELFIVNRYIDTQLRNKYHIQVDPSYWQTGTSMGDRDLGKGGSITSPCAFDSLPPEDRMKPMGLSCGCPKCSPHSVNTKLADCVSTTYLPTPPTTEYIGGKRNDN